MTQAPFTAVIADDHAFTLSGMRQTLEKNGHIDVLGTAQNGISAISLIKQHTPDCAILDYAMPGATGVEVVFEGRRWSPDTRFIVVTGNMAPGPINEMIGASVEGVFAKTSEPAEIADGIMRVLAGETVYCPAVERARRNSEMTQSLTAREREVLHAIARGFSNPQISEHLGLSVKTIESHRASLMRKLEVRSTAALLVRAMKDGVIDVTQSG
jgi:DNA-binding NarL/FixJ family response regulator